LNTGNADKKVKISAVPLLFKLTCFAITRKNFPTQSSLTKRVSTWRPTVLSVSLLLAFPGFEVQCREKYLQHIQLQINFFRRHKRENEERSLLSKNDSPKGHFKMDYIFYFNIATYLIGINKG
jgi:hypothetical protein